MNTYNFDISFTCANSGILKCISKPYKALNKKLAIEGIKDYCITNKTMINPIFNLDNEIK